METTQVEKIQLQFIDIDRDEIYVSFSLKAGFVQKEYANLRGTEKEKITLNSASAGVFAFYLKEQFRLATGRLLMIKGFPNVLTVTLQSTFDRFDKDFATLLDIYFQAKVADELVQKAITDFTEWFKNTYRNLAFRNRLNTWEFSNQMKNYRLMRFLHEVETYTITDFHFFKQQLVSDVNTAVLITGREAAIRERTTFFKEQVFPKRLVSTFIPVKASLDPFTFQDQRRVKYDLQAFQEGCLRFDRLDTRFSNNDMYALLQIIGRCLFQYSFEVEVDSFDASITYTNQGLREYKNSLHQVLTEENVKRAVVSFQNEMKFILSERPLLFNQYYQYLEANSISYLDVLLQIENIQVEEIQMALPFLKVSECHLDVRVKGVSANG